MSDQPDTSNSVEGRVVIITGGGTGIGRAYAKHFAAHGGIPVIAEINGQLWAGFWEWMLGAGGDVCKTMSSRPPASTTASEMAGHIKAGPFATWKPKKGDKVWFFITSLAWPGIDTARERTQVVGPIEWPY